MRLFVPLFTALATVATLGGCGPNSADVEPGRETGSCVDYECLGDLVCLSNLCVDPNATPGEDDGSGTEETEGASVPKGSVSILVVLDNSGSMAEEQPMLTAALETVPQALDDAGIDWRIGITTTDNGNPWCWERTPDAGNFVFSSCRSRRAQFRFDGAQPIDAFEICEDHCPAEWLEIETRPTAIFDDSNTASRSWIQSIGGENNLPTGLGYEDAMRCLLPQGINGCGYEAPLESMYKAIERMEVQTDPNYGFLPPGALLVVLIVSDEVDCSYNPDHDLIFFPNGGRVFWSDDTMPAPSSAICWNAGVQCSEGSCSPADYDVSGGAVEPANAADDAVLRPVSRYIDQIAELDAAIVMTINGIQPDGSVLYDDGTDPVFLYDFGIGPGCTSETGSAVPPVRTRALAMASADGMSNNQFSVCDGSYAGATAALLSAIEARLP